MITIEFIADDLGLDEATNLEIERSHREGSLTGASLMLGQPGSAHAVAVARRNPGLRIGWHFHACDSQPLTRKRWPWGRSPALAGIALLLPSARALVRQEIRSQWDQFRASGLSCSFINGHHHLHIHPFIAREMRAVVSPDFAGWVRGFNVRSFDPPEKKTTLPVRYLRRPAQRWLGIWNEIPRSDSLWGLDRLFCMSAAEVARVVATLPEGLHEFLFHPRGAPNDADGRALRELRPQAEHAQPRWPVASANGMKPGGTPPKSTV